MGALDMEVLLENIITYGVVFLICAFILFFYLRAASKKSALAEEKIKKAEDLGFHEPVSLHPVVNTEMCIGSGACIMACPEKDVLGLVNGHAAAINASRCVGHGACYHACPMNAISLHIGTEKRGVDLPHVSEAFESNVQGLYIAGELGGMGLIKNAVEQGRQAMENIVKHVKPESCSAYDVIIVGAGPAGISASLTAVKNKIRYLTLEQDSLGGTVFNFPRAKIVMTSPMNLPLYGKVKISETSKGHLLELWKDVLGKNDVKINEQEKVLNIEKKGGYFEVTTAKGNYTSDFVLLAIGRRGSPRKLGIQGEEKEKVSYRLLEPEFVKNRNVLVVGGGDSAIEAALALADEGNCVTVSYRAEVFSRIKPRNLEKITEAEHLKKINIIYRSNLIEIKDDAVILRVDEKGSDVVLGNDLVYIFAGGELPAQFLEKIGVRITKKYGEAILK